MSHHGRSSPPLRVGRLACRSVVPPRFWPKPSSSTPFVSALAGPKPVEGLVPRLRRAPKTGPPLGASGFAVHRTHRLACIVDTAPPRPTHPPPADAPVGLRGAHGAQEPDLRRPLPSSTFGLTTHAPHGFEGCRQPVLDAEKWHDLALRVDRGRACWPSAKRRARSSCPVVTDAGVHHTSTGMVVRALRGAKAGCTW